MKKKFLSGLIAISVSMSMGVPVFAADQPVQGTSPQSGTVPVTGSIEKYTPSTPSTEINVSIPTSMVFDIAYDKYTQKSNLTSADYAITNNGDTSVSVTSQYDVTNANGVTLTTPDKVNPTDSNLELALSLNVGQSANPTTPWIQNVTDKSTGNVISVASKATEHMQFSATDANLANITQHAKDGKLTSETNIKGNLVLTFNAIINKNEASSLLAYEATVSTPSTITLSNGNLSISKFKGYQGYYSTVGSYSVNGGNAITITSTSASASAIPTSDGTPNVIKNLKAGDIVEFNGVNPYYFGSIYLGNGTNYTFNSGSSNISSFKIKILSSNQFELITTDSFVQN